jgi:hypothetical protein
MREGLAYSPTTEDYFSEDDYFPTVSFLVNMAISNEDL